MAKIPKKNMPKNSAALAMSAMRTSKLSPERRKEIARHAGIKGAEKRWGKKLQTAKEDAKLVACVRENRRSIIGAIACACAQYAEQAQHSQDDKAREAADKNLSKCLAIGIEIATLALSRWAQETRLRTSAELLCS